MNKIKNKLIVGVLFASFAIIVQTLFKYHVDYFNLVMEHKKQVGLNFVIFFLIGYVILGNLFATKKES